MGMIDLGRRASLPCAILVPVCIGAILMPARARAGVVVTNASFEAPTYTSGNYAYDPTGVPGWTFSGRAGISASSSPWFAGAPPDGSQAAFIQSAPSTNGTISQTLTGFTAGQSYSVTFWIADRPSYSADPVTVSLGGTNLGTFTPTTTSFVQVTTSTLIASATSMTLVFTGAASSGDINSAIDLVSVSGGSTPIPEPAGAALLLAGISILYAVRRRKGAAR